MKQFNDYLILFVMVMALTWIQVMLMGCRGPQGDTGPQGPLAPAPDVICKYTFEPGDYQVCNHTKKYCHTFTIDDQGRMHEGH